MTTIRIEVDAKKMTIDDLIMMEDLRSGKLDARAIKDFIARFIVDENCNPVIYDEAYKIAGKLTLEELQDTFTAMDAKVQELQETAIPPGKGGN